MKKRLLFNLLFIFSIGSIYAQSDYREGYIINFSNDTISGYINYKWNIKSLKKINFKSDLDSKAEYYSPEEIKSFRFSDANLYVSMEVEIDGNIRKYFIEQLIDGIVDVFYYSANNESFFLIRNAKGKIFELKNSRVEIQTEYGAYSKYKKEYAQVLRYLFQDSPTTLGKVENLQLNPNSMIDIARDYHNDVCTEYECVIYAKNKTRVNFDFGLYTGFSISSFSLESEFFNGMNNDFSNSNDLLFGLFLNVMDPNISERFSLQLDLIFQNGKYVFDSSYFDLSYMKVPFSIKYTYPVKKIKPSLQLGIAYNNWYRHEAKNVIREEVEGDAIQQRTYQYGFLIGVEFSYELTKKLGLYAQCRYEKYRGKLRNYYFRPGYGWASEYVNSKTDFIGFTLGLKY